MRNHIPLAVQILTQNGSHGTVRIVGNGNTIMIDDLRVRRGDIDGLGFDKTGHG